jgi:hypothetical protein
MVEFSTNLISGPWSSVTMNRLALELLGVLIALAASVFGIWTSPDRVNATATIATIIAVLGLATTADYYAPELDYAYTLFSCTLRQIA